MKKALKWTAIILSTIVFLIIISASVIVWIVFIPEKLTPIVRKQAAKHLTSKTEIGEVELTFFSTFPLFGLKLTDVTIINTVSGAPSDTLVDAREISAIVDLKSWWVRDELVVNEFLLYEAQINAFIDTAGNANFNIIKPGKPSSEESDTSELMPVNLNNVELHQVSLSYVDLQSNIKTYVKNLESTISLAMVNDSLQTVLEIDEALVSFTYANEPYLKEVAFACEVPLFVNMASQTLKFDNAWLTVNDLQLSATGSIANDTINKKIHTQIRYQIDSWEIEDIIALVPPAFQKYLEGVSFEGQISSKGSITGPYSNSEMPLFDLGIQLRNGTLRYDSFPLPVYDINADLVFYSDLKNNARSYVDVIDFKAQTPKSSFSTKGNIRNLFSDVFFNFSSEAQVTLSEFKPFIPSSLKMAIDGGVSAKLKSVFTLSQAQNVLLNEMKLSGTLNVTDLDLVYDTISVFSDEANVRFSFPNPNREQTNTPTFSAAINTGVLEINMNDNLSTKLQNGSIELASSNFMDTTKLPNVWSNFGFDFLSVNSDSFGANIDQPSGVFSMTPLLDSKAMPAINLEYRSAAMDAWAYNNKFAWNSVDLKTDVKQDPTQKDALLHWKANGSLNLNQASISLASLPDVISINSLNLNFNPETFSIKEGNFKFKDSDFSLSGKLNNITSYLKKDSLLRGDFSFSSNHTDILHLLVITNGLGDTTISDSVQVKKDVNAKEVSETTGPYLVPKGVDFVLHTNVKKASLGYDTISNITGDVRVKDGILVLDNLQLTSPAARIQITSMYRTPRKNHLYLGLDYHMLDVEISNLMNMIPEIDSMMPMLKDFKGKAEFHFAAETYLDSMYNLKMSTIRAASSIRGQNLVLMDGPTFTELSKLLRFNKKTENKIDSLAVEFTVFKNEIDIYPFLIAMDKYKAIISGRHNMDMTFDYHVSLVESPIPVKLGANISGDMENLKYSPARPRYEISYRPTARNLVKDKQLQLRELIRSTLLQKVNVRTETTK